MENKFKILYSDTTGNLNLGKNIGPCDIYITNNINRYTKKFTVISKDGVYCFHFDIDSLELDTTSNGNYSDKYFKSKTIHNKVYKYITTEKDDNNKIKWYNMIDISRLLPPDIKSHTLHSRQLLQIWEYVFIEDVILDNNKYELALRFDYIDYPILHIHPYGTLKNDCMIRLDTLEYFSGEKLNVYQEQDLIKYLCNKDDECRLGNNAWSAFGEWCHCYKMIFNKSYPKDNDTFLLNIDIDTKIN